MKKLFIFFILAAVLLDAKWIDIYKQGDIKLIPDPEFGKKTDWDSIFYNMRKKIAVAPDGSIFVSDKSQDKIYKFDRKGNFLKSFSQRGQGTGDTIGPDEISIFDNHYLAVREGVESAFRISVFDIDTSFVDIIPVRHFIHHIAPLKNRKIAYVYLSERGNEFQYFPILITDFKTKQTIQCTEFKRKRSKSDIIFGEFLGEVFIAPLHEQYLVVGYSESPEITVYSMEGKKLYSFNVNMKPLKVTREMQDEVLKITYENAKKVKNPYMDKALAHLDRSEAFGEYVPYFLNIVVDPDGNILVFKNPGFYKLPKLEFQVYSDKGQYICNSRFDFGSFIPAPTLELAFGKEDIYCLVKKNCDDDECVRLIKVKLK
jgi:hypothetical protein